MLREREDEVSVLSTRRILWWDSGAEVVGVRPTVCMVSASCRIRTGVNLPSVDLIGQMSGSIFGVPCQILLSAPLPKSALP